MKATFVLKNMSDLFYERLAEVSSEKLKFEFLKERATPSYGITLKVGNGQFNQAVEFNTLIKSDKAVYSYKLEQRKGYLLATFEVTKKE